MKRLVLLLAFAASPGWAQDVPAPTDIPVTMPAASQTKMGIAGTVLGVREIADSVDAIVRVIDPAPLATLISDLATATAAAASSANELRRTAGLAAQDQSASQQALEAARARAAADASTVTLLEHRLKLEWGVAFAAQSAADRDALLTSIADGRAALLRADAPQNPNGLVGKVLVETSADGAPIAAKTLGLSGAADPRMQTIGLYCVVNGTSAADLRPGRVFAGRIETPETRTGVVLPRSALIRLSGAVWAYVRTGEEAFVRRQVLDGVPIDDGWFVMQGFAPGVEVVEHGAGSLLALERADESAETD